MSLDETILATELLKLSDNPVDTEAEAVQTLLDAYGNYLLGDPLGVGPFGAEAAGIFLTKAAVDDAKLAAQPTLTGMSDPGPVDPILGVPIYSQGLTKIPDAMSVGLASFWGAIAANFAVAFPGSIAMSAPPHASLAALFEPLMILNTTQELTPQEVADNIAALLHNEAIVGGTITLPGGPPTIHPIT